MNIINILLIFVFLVLIYGNLKGKSILQENMTNATASNAEAIANVASLYNTGNFTMTNATITNDANITNKSTTKNLDVTGIANITIANITNGLNVGSGNNKLTVDSNGNVVIPGNLIINGKLTVNNGSEFKGGRHYFSDSENAGRLRVGGAWGIPGIYAEDGKDVVVGSSTGNIKYDSTNSILLGGKEYGIFQTHGSNGCSNRWLHATSGCGTMGWHGAGSYDNPNVHTSKFRIKPI
jgi:hypothetical protein